MRRNNFIYVYRRRSHVFVFFVSVSVFLLELRNMFFIFLLTQRHLHPTDVENRPNGLTINIFIGRQVGAVVY